ncbi:MAG: hypothetical protein ACREND_16045 [Gemmatimonadaceae bacterium]
MILEGPAQSDLLKSQSIIPGDDNGHVYVASDGRLGYDKNYTTPQDPFRWQKLKDCVDSKEKIVIRRIEKTDKYKSRFIDGKTVKDIDDSLPSAALGVTLITEKLQRKIYAGYKGPLVVSPSADTHYIYYTLLSAKSASAGPLAHELFGHMWLALHGAPFGHPAKPADIKAFGTISAKDAVPTPFGSTYTGTVRDYIREYAESQSLGNVESPTLFVGPTLLDQALAEFEKEFVKNKGMTGKMNGRVSWPGVIEDLWGRLSRNYAMLKLEPAPSTAGTGSGSSAPSKKANMSPRTPTELTQSLTVWYGTLSPTKQYQFLKFAKNWAVSGSVAIDLAADLMSLPKPKGMR